MRCAVALASLRAEPGDDAEQVSQLLEGEPVSVVERREGWARVLTAYDYPGWVRAEALAEGGGALVVDVAAPPLAAARSYLGAPYEWGGMTHAGIDCSGLVHMAYRRAGRLVPRDAHQQAAAAEPVTSPRPGDLVTYGLPADHIAFWLGGGRILHSTGRDGGIGVVEEPEPVELRARRNGFVRLGGRPITRSG